MALKTKPYDEAKYLETPDDCADILNDALGTGHPGYIASALGAVARAHGMSALARDTGLKRQALYRALSENGNPTLETVLKVANALGIQLSATVTEREQEAA